MSQIPFGRRLGVILLLAALAWLVPVAAMAQGLSIAPPPVDLSQVATKADLNTSVPPVCTQPPAPDAMAATAGVGAPCTPRADAARQTPIPPASATTVSGGTFTGTWSMTLSAPPSRAIATVEGSTPYHCQIVTKTTTGFTGKCWLVNTTTTLPTLASSLLGYTVPLLVDSAAGITVTVLARQ